MLVSMAPTLRRQSTDTKPRKPIMSLHTDKLFLTVNEDLNLLHSFQVNNISNSLLSVLLLPLLARTSRLPPLPTTGTFKPHLAIVSSEMHVLAPKGVPGAKGGKEEVLSHFTEEKLFDSTPRYMETKGESDCFADYLGISYGKFRG